jgi:multiple sugar transport system permease protein
MLVRTIGKIWHGYVFVAPAALFLMVFSYGAILFSLYVSFRSWDIVNPEKPFVGLDNFRRALDSPLFWTALQNTATYAVAIVPAVTALAFVLALFAHHAPRGRGFFRTVYFIPTITPGVVISLIWAWLYAPSGPISGLIAQAGITPPNWLNDPGWALPSIIFMSVWTAVGYYMIVFIAGRADVPEVYYDAAKVDGANSFQMFWHITIPLMRNSIAFVVVVLTIGAFQVFTQMYVMTRGGPANATISVQYLIYTQGFQQFHMGYAAAISWLLFAVIFCFSAIQLRIFQSTRVY